MALGLYFRIPKCYSFLLPTTTTDKRKQTTDNNEL